MKTKSNVTTYGTSSLLSRHKNIDSNNHILKSKQVADGVEVQQYNIKHNVNILL